MAQKRWFKIASILLIVVLISAGGFAGYVGYSVYFRPLPKTSGTGQVPGLRDTVSIYRDNWSIPQIYATNTNDLFFTQGYVQAQERWWQMELGRFLGMGRLREILTNEEIVLNADRWMLMLGLTEAARSDWNTASPEVRRALTAYSAGVNAYIQNRSVEDLATEYGLIGLSGQLDNLLAYLGRDVQAEPWEPYHSLLLLRLFALGMDGDLWSELEHPALIDHLSPDLLSAYLLDYPYTERPTTLSADELRLPVPSIAEPPSAPLVVDGVTFGDAFVALMTRLVGSASPDLMELLGFHAYLGGDAWVVSGIHTHSGKPLLANDLQMPIEIPSPWFEMGLHCTSPGTACPYLVTGFSLPGTPGIIVGHNDRITWGLNASQADVQDLYLLRLNPDNPTQYEVDGEWLDMEPHTVILQQNEENEEELPLEFVYYTTRYGPLITDITAIFDDPLLAESDYQAIALHWSATDQRELMGAVLGLNRAQNWNEFRAALSDWRWPAMNFVYADVDGNIGYQMAGAIPVRASQHSGLTPVPGWLSDFDWRGLVPFGLLPSVYNPTDGVIVDAGNAVVPLAYYEWLAQQLATRDSSRYPTPEAINVAFSRQWMMGYQASRITSRVDAVEKHSVDSFAQIQGDIHNTFAADILPYVFDLTFDTVEFQDTLDWFKTWDLQNQMESPQAALFAVFWSELSRLTFADQLGEQRDGFDADMWAITELMKQPENEWWDDIASTFTRETRDDIVHQAFINAYDILVNRLGTDRTEWSWGQLHQGKFVSRIIGQQDFLPNNPAINSGPFPINQGPFGISGGISTVNATLYRTVPDEIDPAYTVIALPSYRLIVDLGNFDNSRALHTTGQSGHPASDNYKDMIVPWRTVEYHDLRWGANEIRQGASRRLDLRPE